MHHVLSNKLSSLFFSLFLPFFERTKINPSHLFTGGIHVASLNIFKSYQSFSLHIIHHENRFNFISNIFILNLISLGMSNVDHNILIFVLLSSFWCERSWLTNNQSIQQSWSNCYYVDLTFNFNGTFLSHKTPEMNL